MANDFQPITDRVIAQTIQTELFLSAEYNILTKPINYVLASESCRYPKRNLKVFSFTEVPFCQAREIHRRSLFLSLSYSSFKPSMQLINLKR